MIAVALMAAHAPAYAADIESHYVDLSAAPGAVASLNETKSPASGVVTHYFDLTAGNGAKEVPPPAIPPAETRTPATRFIDLSAGASPDGPAVNEAEITLPPVKVIDPADPYEESNRARFETHVALHRNVIDPVETVYIDAVPEPARAGLHNILTNLEAPSVFINDVLQIHIGGAGETLTRFVVNSTLGIAGIFDVATHFGLSYRDNDFGHTLADYGVSDRPYLLVPVIGPSNPRDLTGKVVDFALNPLHYIAVPGGIATSIGHAGAHELDKRSADVGALDMLARTVPDAYAAEKHEARKRREQETGTYSGP
jgi:phospholipid-binding lipoprotein MlaA